LSFLETFPAAGRASVPIGQSRRVAIVSSDDRLRLYGHLMNGPIAEIRQLFRMARGQNFRFRQRGPYRTGRCRILAERPQPWLEYSPRRPSLHYLRLRTCVPTGRGQPHFDLNIRVTARLHRRRDTAECRQIPEEPGLLREPAATRCCGWHESPRRDWAERA